MRRFEENRSPVVIDDLDRHIIDLLREGGRMSNRMVGRIVGLTEATVAARIRSLHELHVLSVSAVLDWQRAGYLEDAWLMVGLDGGSPREAARKIARLPGVHAVSVVLGAIDLVVHVLAPNRAALLNLTEALSDVDGVDNINTLVTIETAKYDVSLAGIPSSAALEASYMEVDDLDLKIINALCQDGRQSNRQIGRDLHVSDGTIRSRILRMEDDGLLRIRGQSNGLLTGDMSAVAFATLHVRPSMLRKVMSTLAEVPEVGLLATISGLHNLLVIVPCKSHERLVALVGDIRSMEGVRSVETLEVVDLTYADHRWVRLLNPPSPASDAD